MLKGTLDDFTLPDVFRLMSFAKKTGRVDIVRSAGQGKVYFREGEVYFAESSLSKEPLGQKLVRSRALTEGQLMKALDEQAASKERLGTVLLSSGLVSEEQLEGAVRQQIEDAIFDLLRWELGEFAWEPDGAIETEVQIGVSVENLIMEASRRLDEYEVIKRKIPSGLSVLGMAAAPPEGAVEINITPQEWRILVLVDGSRTVQDIAAMVGLDEFGAMRVLYGLVSAGLIELISEGAYVPEPIAEVITEEPSPEPIVEPVVEPEPVPEPVAVVEPEPVPEPVAVVEPEPVTQEPTADPVRSQPISDELAADVIAALGSYQEPVAPEPETVSASSDNGFSMDVAELESFGISPLGGIDSTTSTDDAVWAEASPIEAFDAPKDDELVTSTPEPDTFVEDLFAETPAPAAIEEPPAPPEVPAQPEIPVSSAPSGDEPSVDRAAVVRELAGLFSDEERPRARPSAPPPSTEPDDERKRVEDDDQVTKGIISRLIDGVKGL
ncbi:MAG: hypothetical protein QOG04_2301 [Actinomycetota bacterium]|nr:hypothetical protein [Actinomycetota bacterium]